MSLKISLSTFRALNAHLPNIRCNIGLKTICNEVYCIYNIGVKAICNEINCIHSLEKIFPYLQSNMESRSSKIVSDVLIKIQYNNIYEEEIDQKNWLRKIISKSFISSIGGLSWNKLSKYFETFVLSFCRHVVT